KPVIQRTSSLYGSAKREYECLSAGIKKLDLESSVLDRLRLSNQLIHSLLVDDAVAVLVHVDSVRLAGWLPIDQHSKSDGSPSRRGSHDEMEIPGVEARDDASIGRVQRGGPFPNCPIAGERPFVEPQARGRRVGSTGVQSQTTGRREVLGAFIAQISFRG